MKKSLLLLAGITLLFLPSSLQATLIDQLQALSTIEQAQEFRRIIKATSTSELAQTDQNGDTLLHHLVRKIDGFTTTTTKEETYHRGVYEHIKYLILQADKSLNFKENSNGETPAYLYWKPSIEKFLAIDKNNTATITQNGLELRGTVRPRTAYDSEDE